MQGRAIIVLDVGKTHAKLSLWAWDGTLIERRVRANARDGLVLDSAGIETWLAETLTDFATLAAVGAIIPVAHGAAAALISDDALLRPPVDYEAEIPPEVRTAYDALRDSFAATGAPLLPQGLNLGAQLYAQGPLPKGAQILLWPQYWAWVLSGVAASEVTSLGCHTDLWHPNESRPATLAANQGWADCLPPLRAAADVLGTITPEWATLTGLPLSTKIYCGLHDSNAALLAARAFPEIADNEATVLSTGTWFVAMRTPAAPVDLAALSEVRDCLVNVDAYGQPIPSARWMGGREIEQLIGLDTRGIDIKPDQPALLAAVPEVIDQGAMLLPSFATGVGPFPQHRGAWVNCPEDWIAQRAAVCLYAALVTHQSLDIIGARDRILVEGRFAEAEVFVRALASLRPNDTIYVANAHSDVSFGALRLINSSLKPNGALVKGSALDTDLLPYAQAWRQTVAQREGTS